jgi:hypothetical protein
MKGRDAMTSDGWEKVIEYRSYGRYRHPAYPRWFIHWARVRAHRHMGYRYAVFLSGATATGFAKFMHGCDRLTEAKKFVMESAGGADGLPHQAKMELKGD